MDPQVQPIGVGSYRCNSPAGGDRCWIGEWRARSVGSCKNSSGCKVDSAYPQFQPSCANILPLAFLNLLFYEIQHILDPFEDSTLIPFKQTCLLRVVLGARYDRFMPVTYSVLCSSRMSGLHLGSERPKQTIFTHSGTEKLKTRRNYISCMESTSPICPGRRE